MTFIIRSVTRDWEEPKERRFYDQYTYNNLNDLFHAEIQKFDNFYKYDESLSPSKFVTQQSNFAEIQPRDYNPEVAETCYTAYPKRLIYSLQANEEDRKDYWRQYLFANYKDFKNRTNQILNHSLLSFGTTSLGEEEDVLHSAGVVRHIRRKREA